MNKTLKQVIVFILTLFALIAIFWIVLPFLGIASLFGSLYFVVVLAGSFLLSMLISRWLSRTIR